MTITDLGSRHARVAHHRRSPVPVAAPPRSIQPTTQPVQHGSLALPTAAPRGADIARERTTEIARERTTEIVRERTDIVRERSDRLLSEVTEQRPLTPADIDAVVLLNLGLADGIASRYLGRGIERDDLIQVARLGLVKAVHRYRPALGQSFAGFAAPTISGEIKRHFRDTGWMVRPPRRLQELGARLRETEKDLEQRLRRKPTPAELAAALGVDETQVRAAREASSSFHAVSLDAPVTAEHRPDLAVDAGDDPFSAFDDAQWLTGALGDLSGRERTVLTLRFVESLTQSEIAQKIGVSQMQVSRILRATLERLRIRLQSSLGDAA